MYKRQVQFHPEVNHTEHGEEMLKNFLFRVCGCQGDWKMSSFVDDTVQKDVYKRQTQEDVDLATQALNAALDALEPITDPTDPSTPTDPSDPTEPEPTDPTEPTDPVQPLSLIHIFRQNKGVGKIPRLRNGRSRTKILLRIRRIWRLPLSNRHKIRILPLLAKTVRVKKRIRSILLRISRADFLICRQVFTTPVWVSFSTA